LDTAVGGHRRRGVVPGTVARRGDARRRARHPPRRVARHESELVLASLIPFRSRLTLHTIVAVGRNPLRSHSKPILRFNRSQPTFDLCRFVISHRLQNCRALLTKFSRIGDITVQSRYPCQTIIRQRK